MTSYFSFSHSVFYTLWHLFFILTHSHAVTPLGNKPFENAVGNREIARNKQFLLFPVFSTRLDYCLPFSSANSFSLEESKILVMG